LRWVLIGTKDSRVAPAAILIIRKKPFINIKYYFHIARVRIKKKHGTKNHIVPLHPLKFGYSGLFFKSFSYFEEKPLKK
jgi:hypothetical protein